MAVVGAILAVSMLAFSGLAFAQTDYGTGTGNTGVTGNANMNTGVGGNLNTTGNTGGANTGGTGDANGEVRGAGDTAGLPDTGVGGNALVLLAIIIGGLAIGIAGAAIANRREV